MRRNSSAERSVAPRHFRIAFENFVNVGVRHALGGTNHAGREIGGRPCCPSASISMIALITRRSTCGFSEQMPLESSSGQHGHGAIREIDRGAAQTRFAVERRIAPNVMRHVRDVHLQFVMCRSRSARDIHGVVEIARRFAINRDDRQIAKIARARASPASHTCCGVARGLRQHFRRKNMRQMMLANDDFNVHADFAGTSKNFDHAAGRREAAFGIARDFDIHNGAIEFRQGARGGWQRFAPRCRMPSFRAAQASIRRPAG